MSTRLKHYLKDGACHQARAVLAYLQGRGDIEESWDSESSSYKAEIKVARWENCREQGYIVSLIHNGTGRQLNVAFFEHRNSDSICALKWDQRSMNSITIDTANFPDDDNHVYRDKYDVSHKVKWGEAFAMAKWIHEQLTNFWIECEGMGS